MPRIFTSALVSLSFFFVLTVERGEGKLMPSSLDVVHALSYSILLLNTDLHIVDTTSRMSRSQFIKNTMETLNVQILAIEDLAEEKSMRIAQQGREPPLTLAEFMTSVAPRPRPNRFRVASKSTIDGELLHELQSKARTSLEKWTSDSRLLRRSDSTHSVHSEGSTQSHGGMKPGGLLSLSSEADIAEAIARQRSLDVVSPVLSIASQLEATINPSQFSRLQFEKEIDVTLKVIYLY